MLILTSSSLSSSFPLLIFSTRLPRVHMWKGNERVVVEIKERIGRANRLPHSGTIPFLPFPPISFSFSSPHFLSFTTRFKADSRVHTWKGNESVVVEIGERELDERIDFRIQAPDAVRAGVEGAARARARIEVEREVRRESFVKLQTV
jgi:hypothetical protein